MSFIPKFRWQGRRLRIQQLQQHQQQVQCGQGCLLLLLLQGDRGHGGVDDGGVEGGDHGGGRDVEAGFFALGPLLCPEIQEKVKGPDLVSAKELCRLFHSESMVLQRLQESSKEPERKRELSFDVYIHSSLMLAEKAIMAYLDYFKMFEFIPYK